MLKSLLLLTFTSFLVGCTTIGDDLTKAHNAQGIEKTKSLDAAYQKALDTCTAEAQNQRNRFYGNESWHMGFAIVGVMAGAIVVPALAAQAVVAKSTLAAWGGLAGAMNGAQYAIDSNGFSPSQQSETYSRMRADIKTAMDSYTSAHDDSARENAINQLIVTCQVVELPPPTTTTQQQNNAHH